MPSMMDHVADVAHRGGVELVRLARLYPFPDFVKQAGQENSLRVPPGTPVTACADPVNRQFWCHTKAACWLSHLFYSEKRAEFHPKDRERIEERLAKYAANWGIKAACDALAARRAELTKAADADLPDSAYAHVWVDRDGRKVRQYPLRSAMEVKAAAEWVEQYRDRLPFPTRHAMAKKILEKAAQYGAGVGPHREFLEKQAGMGVCDPAAVVAMIEKRAYLVPADAGVTFDDQQRPTDGLRQRFLKMAATVKALPRKALQPDMLVKLAATVDQLDRLCGLTGAYSDAVPRPEDVIFGATFGKAAAELVSHVATTTGKYYEKAALKKVAAADLRALFGDEFVERVQTPLGDVDEEKMAEEVSTLPRPDAQLLDGLLSEQGISPVMHKAADARHGLTAAAMEAIAAHYG